MARSRRVAVFIQVATGFGRDVRRGIGRYAQSRGGWEFHSLSGGPFLKVEDLASWDGDGAITMVGDEQQRDRLRESGLAVVNIASRLPEPGLPSVLCDNEAIGRLAADHLLDRGFEHLAFYGYPQAYTQSEQRFAGFAEQARQRHIEPDRLRLRDWAVPAQAHDVFEWLSALPRPLGLFAATDELAKVVADVCWQHDIHVPEQVAILGADNDEPLLEMANPALSSIDVNAMRLGYEAAAVLDQLMADRAPPASAVLIPPVGVVTRRSTDIYAISDPDVARALRSMRERCDEPLTVLEVVRELAISRRAFEKRFKQHVGRTPWEEIRRVQIEYVKRLLRDTDMPIHQVADRSAFCDPRRLSNIFREETGTTPRAYRNSHRGTR